MFSIFREEYWKDRQPDGAELEACTMMIITSLHSLSKWYDIPCASHEANQYICSKTAAHLSSGEQFKCLPLFPLLGVR